MCGYRGEQWLDTALTINCFCVGKTETSEIKRRNKCIEWMSAWHRTEDRRGDSACGSNALAHHYTRLIVARKMNNSSWRWWIVWTHSYKPSRNSRKKKHWHFYVDESNSIVKKKPRLWRRNEMKMNVWACVCASERCLPLKIIINKWLQTTLTLTSRHPYTNLHYDYTSSLINWILCICVFLFTVRMARMFFPRQFR